MKCSTVKPRTNKPPITDHFCLNSEARTMRTTSSLLPKSTTFAAVLVTTASLLAGATVYADTFSSVDISAYFNADTIAIDTSDSAGDGFRGSVNEKFLVADRFPTDRTLDPPYFQLGPYDGNNTVRLGLNDSVTIDLEDAMIDELDLLHTAVGFNTTSEGQNETNGKLTLFYTDSSSEELVWDVADNDGNNSQGLSESALTGLTLYIFSNGSSQSGRRLWHQVFDVDETKTLDRIELSTAGVVDGGGTDANFGIYGLSAKIATVPEPSTLAMALLGLVGLMAGWRRGQAVR